MTVAFQTPPRDRLIAGAGSGLVVALLGGVLVFGLHVQMPPAGQTALALLDLHAPPPPPKKEEKPVEREKRSPAKDKPSPANLKAKPSEVVAPVPLVIPPPKPPPIVAAPIKGPGAAPSAGASDRPGPGYGAGGDGDGLGGGGDGDGGDTPPEQVRGKLRFEDLPIDLRHAGFRATVGVVYHVTADGRVDDCKIQRSSGHAELDSTTCGLIEARFRFRPSRDGNGRAVAAWIDESHEWGYDIDPGDRD